MSLFGSCATGLELPTSDLDVMVTGEAPAAAKSIGDDFVSLACDPRVQWLQAVAHALVQDGVAASAEVLSRAQVPIVRFVEVQSQLEVDINGQGIDRAGAWILEQRETLPAFRPVVLALKVFFAQRGFHKTFEGGIGSYLLYAMVAEAARSIGAHSPSHDEATDAEPIESSGTISCAFSCDALLLAFLQRFSGQSGKRRVKELRCPVSGGPLGEKAYRSKYIMAELARALEWFQSASSDSKCLSHLVRGWPVNDVVCTRDALASLLAPPHVQPPAWEVEAELDRAAARARNETAHREREAREIVTSVLHRLVKKVVTAAEHEEREAREIVTSVLHRLIKEVVSAAEMELRRGGKRAAECELKSHKQARCLCFNCGESGHRGRDCPQPRAPSKSLHVTNLPKDTDTGALDAHMTAATGPCSVRLHFRQRDEKFLGSATVTFDSVERAKAAREILANSEFQGQRLIAEFTLHSR